jgi:hypothetical protein
LASDYSKAIDYRSSRLGNGVAPTERAQMDLQEIRRANELSGEIRYCSLVLAIGSKRSIQKSLAIYELIADYSIFRGDSGHCI